ncbi:MAG TPA: hypothetical protein VE075_09820 [Thermoanaerobaculia bacterium]|nr:hypothetical protein [Thermoanaerobaculia bacterium]
MAALLGALAAWGGWFIFRSSFVLGGRRVFWLFDDAMISMTYARNLVEGYGLNWARHGAPVEGFTHPLWVALMVPVNLLPLPLERRSLVVQLVSLALLAVNVVLVRRLVLRHFSRPGARHWATACVLTAFYYPLDYWSLMGMESGLQAVLLTASVLVALDIVHLRRDRYLALWLLGALAALLRLDMLLPVAAIQAYVLAFGRPAARAWRHWLAGAAALAAAVGGYGIFRWAYFHDLLPNTYYLKLGGVPLAVRLLRGGSVLFDTLIAQWPLLLAVAAGSAPWLWSALRRRDPGEWPASRRRRRDRDWGRRLALPLLVLMLCCAYSVYVGGDAWEGKEVRANRFVAFAMPQLFVALNALLNQALAAAARRRRLKRGPERLPARRAQEAGAALAPRLAVTAVTAMALLSANALWPMAGDGAGWRNYLSLCRPLAVAYHALALGRLRALQQIATPPAVVAVLWAGIPAYFSDFKLVDELGYNNRHLAHAPPTQPLSADHARDFHPGHVKANLTYVLEMERPDAFERPFRPMLARPQLLAHGYRLVAGFWVAPASPRLRLPPGSLAPADWRAAGHSGPDARVRPPPPAGRSPTG